MDLFNLNGEVAVVIGATGALGGAIAEGLGEAGARVAIVGRNEERGQARVKAVQSKGAKAAFFAADAVKRESIQAAHQAIEKALGAPTILVNANGSESVISSVKGTCNNPFNKDVTRSSPLTGLSLDAEGPTLQGRGTIDPNNPDVISGTDSTTLPTQRGGQKKVTIKWNLRKCQDQ